ncbi:DUF5787 family protein [Halospeciosus flavus]|uniref:DUF5787 family protein n=1 Tax=Halospeciosus flavus TaxID=3032283 RepID=A0ABD5Z4U7_9EURY|nr:DUF5787 family protein [Halospeciosus flavus]
MTAGDSDHEFGFELRFCAWAERAWDAHADSDDFVVARQLGTRGRRWDTVIVESTPEALRERAALGADTLDPDLQFLAEHAPAEWAWYRDALPDPGYPWRYVRQAIHRGAARGVVEKRRNGNRIQIRRVGPYPDWVERLVAVEHKPDLDASAARDLADQLERDVALGLADEVWLATEATGARVEPALLEEMPVEVGILVFDPVAGDVEVVWYPRSLDPDAPGERVRGGESESVDADRKAELRARIAERAYGRGWRHYVDNVRPDCRHFHLRRADTGYVPACGAKGCEQSESECGSSCPEFEPEPPTWRQQGWPVEGGPGKTIQRVLAARRRRERPGLGE